MLLRNGVGSVADFLAAGSSEGATTRRLKWAWIQHGIDAPGAADKIRLYDEYLKKMDQALGQCSWLVEDRFSMADIAMTPYVNRIAALSMDGLWSNGRLPRVEAWFARIRERPAFEAAFGQWMPPELEAEMRGNGRNSWPRIREILEIAR
jgi:glutathione S-transferase